MDTKNILISALRTYEESRERSQQIEIGASQIGGCRRQAWHTIQQTPRVNFETDFLAALIGTAIHGVIEKALKSYDIFGDEFVIEKAVSLPQLPGHCDFYSRTHRTVVDWKTSTKDKMVSGKHLDKQKKIQVNLYAKMLNENPEPHPVERVSLAFIPRDGRLRDITVWEDDYNPKLAEEGLAWLDDIQNLKSAPAPERSARYFCADFCKFYDATGGVGCPGK